MCTCDNQLQPHDRVEGICPADARKVIEDLLEAGNDIRCYPEGEVGFEDWWEAADRARAFLAKETK